MSAPLPSDFGLDTITDAEVCRNFLWAEMIRPFSRLTSRPQPSWRIGMHQRRRRRLLRTEPERGKHPGLLQADPAGMVLFALAQVAAAGSALAHSSRPAARTSRAHLPAPIFVMGMPREEGSGRLDPSSRGHKSALPLIVSRLRCYSSSASSQRMSRAAKRASRRRCEEQSCA